MSSLKAITEAVLLSIVVLCAWIGSIGMLRAKEPTTSLHFLALPATLGAFALVVAVFLRTGNSQASWKTVLIFMVMLAINAVVAHGTARAFRTRQLGSWEPRPEERIEHVHAHPHKRGDQG